MATYLDFLLNVTLGFVSVKITSSSELSTITSSKTTPRAWDFDEALAVFIGAVKANNSESKVLSRAIINMGHNKEGWN